MKKLLKCLAVNIRLRKERDVLIGLYDDKSTQVKRYIKTVAQLENQIEALKEENLRLEGKLFHQKEVTRFYFNMYSNLLAKRKAEEPKVTKLTVTDVKTET